jgi:hypothetical protein
MFPTIRKLMQLSKITKVSYFPQINFSSKENGTNRNPLNSATLTKDNVNEAAANTLAGDYLRSNDPINQHSVERKRIYQDVKGTQDVVVNEPATGNLKAEMEGAGFEVIPTRVNKVLTENAKTREDVKRQINEENKAFGLTEAMSGAHRGTFIHPTDPNSSPKSDTMSYINETQHAFPQDHNLTANRESPYAQKIRDQKLSTDNWAAIPDDVIDKAAVFDHRTTDNTKTKASHSIGKSKVPSPKTISKITDNALHGGRSKIPTENTLKAKEKKPIRAPTKDFIGDPLDPTPPFTNRDIDNARMRENLSPMDRKQFGDLKSEPLHSSSEPLEVPITHTINRKVRKQTFGP